MTQRGINVIYIFIYIYINVFRKMWCDYFTDNNIMVAFWSALAETERQKEVW